jgi:release factor glutamine methyltransferase
MVLEVQSRKFFGFEVWGDALFCAAVTVLEVIRRSSEFLARKGVESPRLQVELLLEKTLGMPRLKLYLNHEMVLTEAQLATLRELVARRGAREPLQHLTGATSFCGFAIAVGPEVLVPRPETEILAELAWRHLQKLANRAPAGFAPRVLDFGTGSGCLAIAIAGQCPSAVVDALDLSQAALARARENAAKNQVGDRIALHAGDGFGALPDERRFDLIVSNPPYIPTGDIDGLQPEVRDHDPRLALDGGPDGLDFYRRLAREAPDYLAAEGTLMAEFGDGQETAIARLLEEAGWRVESVRRDDADRARIVIACRDE